MENDKKEKEEENMKYREVDDYMYSYPKGYIQDMRQQYANHYVLDGYQLNPKQFFWIRKRKIRREVLDSLMVAQKSNYLHESRHRHAVKRLRAPSGRFLTKEEAEALEKGKIKYDEIK